MKLEITFSFLRGGPSFKHSELDQDAVTMSSGSFMSLEASPSRVYGIIVIFLPQTLVLHANRIS